MKIKKVFITLALTQLCATLAFSQTKKVSAKDLLSQGIAAEQKGDNIQALTLFIQAYTVDRKLADAEKRMWNSLEIVRFGNFNSSFNKETQSQNPAELMKLRNDWDKLFEATAKFIESNPPKFGLAYNDNPEICDIDYTNGTVSVSVDAPFLYELYEVGFQNQKLVDALSFTFEHIEKHKDWGEKINFFPWAYFIEQLEEKETYYKYGSGSYAAYKKIKSWIQKMQEHPYDCDFVKGYGNVGEPEKYDFTLSLKSDNKILSSKEISRTVLYSYRFVGFQVNAGEKDREAIIFESIPLEDVNSDNLHIVIDFRRSFHHAKYSTTAKLKAPISISITLANKLDDKYKLEENFRKTMEQLKQTNYRAELAGIPVGITYYTYDAMSADGLKELTDDYFTQICCKVSKELDLSKTYMTKIDFRSNLFFYGYSIETLTLPSTLVSLIVWESPPKIKKINFCGTEEQWKLLINDSEKFDSVEVNFNYKGGN